MKGFTLIELAIVIVIAALLAAVAVPIYNGIVKDSKWSEAKTAIGSLKAAIDTYSAKAGGDINDLTLNAGNFTDADLDLIRVEYSTLDNLQYFERDDFTIVITDNAAAATPTPDTYVITCTADAAGLNGKSGNGPIDGYVDYDSSTGLWDEDY